MMLFKLGVPCMPVSSAAGGAAGRLHWKRVGGAWAAQKEEQRSPGNLHSSMKMTRVDTYYSKSSVRQSGGRQTLSRVSACGTEHIHTQPMG